MAATFYPNDDDPSPRSSWAEVERWLDELIDADQDTARTRLSENGAHEDVRREVLELLGFRSERDALERNVGSAAPDLLRDIPMEETRAGEKLGNYRLGERLGAGGMGSVFRATRIEGDFEHQVAIKILRSEMKDSLLARRFAEEREILARLDHPNIAKLFDGGTTDDGLPYFVLELVLGARPITEYCAVNETPLRHRVEMVRAACDAVQSAHQRLVVHRDIKPSNVLVDESGVVKLVDFGIAKPLLPDGVLATDLAQQTTYVLLTPLSSSPEQMAGEPVGTTSDVYQLGLLLYELATSKHPHRPPADSKSGLRRHVLTGEITKPSEVVESLDSASDEENPLLPSARDLRGDLDAVLLKSLEKDPEDRYQSVADFSSDLDNWLQGRPVSAQPDRWFYRARRWMARNRLATVALAIAVVSLLAVAAISVVFALNSSHQARAIERERDLAEEAQNLMAELFAITGPENRSADNQLTASEVLERGERQLRATLRNERPELLARMLRALAESNANLGRFERAGSLVEEAASLHRELASGPSVEEAVDYVVWAEIEQAFHNFDRARERAREALAMFSSLEDPPTEELDRARYLFAWNSIQVSEDPAPEHVETVHQLTNSNELEDSINLARVLRRIGDFEGAIGMYENALRDHDAELAEQPSRRNLLLNNLAFARKSSGDAAGSIAAYEQALDGVDDLYGEGHPNSLTVLGNLARAHLEAGSSEAAIALFGQLLERTREHHAGTWRVGNSLGSLAHTHFELENFAEAARLGEEEVRVYRETLGEDHGWLIEPAAYLGLTYLALDRDERAARWLERAFSGYQKLGIEGARSGRRGVEQFVEIAERLGEVSTARRFRALIEGE